MCTTETDGAERPFLHVDQLQGPVRDTDPPGVMHAHPGIHQVCCLEAGGGKLVLNDETRKIVAPMLIHLPPGISHRLHLNDDASGHVLSFADDFVRTTPLKYRKALTLSLAGKTRSQQSLREICSRIQHEFIHQERGTEPALEACLALLIIEIDRIAPGGEYSSTLLLERAQSSVARYRELIERDFLTGKNLPVYVEELGTTVDSLNEHCKLITGKTAGQILRDRILAEAMRALILSDLPIGDIASRLGFSDASYFVRFFKKATGQPPQQYRRTLGKTQARRPHVRADET